jgi:hypothetical protein
VKFRELIESVEVDKTAHMKAKIKELHDLAAAEKINGDVPTLMVGMPQAAARKVINVKGVSVDDRRVPDLEKDEVWQEKYNHPKTSDQIGVGGMELINKLMTDLNIDHQTKLVLVIKSSILRKLTGHGDYHSVWRYLASQPEINVLHFSADDLKQVPSRLGKSADTKALVDKVKESPEFKKLVRATNKAGNTLAYIGTKRMENTGTLQFEILKGKPSGTKHLWIHSLHTDPGSLDLSDKADQIPGDVHGHHRVGYKVMGDGRIRRETSDLTGKWDGPNTVRWGRVTPDNAAKMYSDLLTQLYDMFQDDQRVPKK